MSDLVRLTGLWVNETKDGKKYFSGSLGAARVVIFKNDHKETDKHPDYILYLSPSDKKGSNNKQQAEEYEDIPF
jgi:hypothetical protein